MTLESLMNWPQISLKNPPQTLPMNLDLKMMNTIFTWTLLLTRFLEIFQVRQPPMYIVSVTHCFAVQLGLEI